MPSLRKNMFALSLVQISSYVLPLITLPYLTRVLGVEAFGKVAFAQVIMAFLIMIVDYGFSWSATRKIAARRDDKAFISRVFMATFVAQWLLVVLVSCVISLLVLYVDRLRADALLYAAAFVSVVGTALFPVWFLQGLERLQLVSLLQIVSRLIVIVPIFLFVKQPDDAVWVLLISGIGVALGGVGSLWWMQKQRLIDWNWPGWAQIVSELHEGAALFGSRISISLYSTLVPLILGWVAGPVALAYFNLADKLRRAAQSAITPLSQALFPRMSYLIATRDGSAFTLLKRSALAVIIIGGVASTTLWLLSDWLVWLMGGEDFSAASVVLKWLSPLPLIIGFSNFFGVQIMLPKGLTRIFNVVLFGAAVISLILVWPLSYKYMESGAAITVLIVELVVTLSMASILWHRGLFVRENWGNK